MATAIASKAASAPLPILPPGMTEVDIVSFSATKLTAAIATLPADVQAFLRVAAAIPGHDGLRESTTMGAKDLLWAACWTVYEARAAETANPVAIRLRAIGKNALELTFSQGASEIVVRGSFSSLSAKGRGPVATNDLLSAVLKRVEWPRTMAPKAWMEEIAKLTIPTLADIPAALEKLWEPQKAAHALVVLKEKGLLAALKASKPFALIIPGYTPTAVSTHADAARLYLGTLNKSPKPSEFPEGVIIATEGGADHRILTSGVVVAMAG